MSIIEFLSRNHLQIPAEHDLTATFLARGAFNRDYTIATSDRDGVASQLPYVFRVTLPAEPLGLGDAFPIAPSSLASIRPDPSRPLPLEHFVDPTTGLGMQISSISQG